MMDSHHEKNLLGFWANCSHSRLVDNGFEQIQNTNDHNRNFPFADLFAVKNGKRFVISVKARNKYQKGGKKLNSRFKLGAKCYENAEKAKTKYEAEPHWIAVQFHGSRYSIYFGSLAQLDGNRGIPMDDKDLSSYRCLVDDEDHGIDFRPGS
jgi:hypothetical protein